jgi:acetate kinase
MEEYLNTETGLLGLTGTTDLRHILHRASTGDMRAKIAVEAFVYHIHKAIYAFVGVLGGIDSIVLTATALERNSHLRKEILQGLSHLGLIINHETNDETNERFAVLTTPDSAVGAYIIPTSEMKEMARVASQFTEGVEVI